MVKIKGWVKDSRANAWYNKVADKSVIVQDGTNIVFVMDWKKGRRTESPPAPTKAKAIAFAKNYMRRHPND